MAKQDLKGKVVVITGASSGFGKGTALELARAQAHLVLAARRADLLTELAHQCEEFGVQTLAVPTDVGDRKQVEDLCQSVLGRFGRIDVWINNAGVGALGRFEAVPLEDHVKVIETDLLGTLYGSYVAPRTEEKLGAKQIHKTQMQDAPAAPETGGAVRSPIPLGTAIRGGRLEQRH